MTEDTELKVSEEFTDRVKRIKEMPAKTEEEKELRSEAFAEMRANYLLDNAKLMAGATSALLEDPKMTAVEMEKYLQDFFVVDSPDKVHEYVQELTKSKNKVLWAIDALKAKDPGQHAAWPARLFTYLVNDPTVSLTEDQKLPNGKVRFGKRHPLAIALEVEDPEDYKRVKEEGDKSAGFYSGSHLVWSDDGEGKYIPVIVTKGFGNPENWKHETGHAESQVIWNTAESMRQARRIWEHSDYIQSKTDVSELAGFFDTEHSEEELAEFKKSKTWRDSISFAHAHAKHEILSEVSHKYGTLEEHLNVLKDKNRLYDYFSRELKVPKGSKLYDELWADYAAKLEASTVNLVTLNGFYIMNSDWHKRRDMFRLVAAQIPVREWQEKLENDGFMEEMKRYNEVRTNVKELKNDLAKIHKRPLSESERSITEELEELKEELSFTVRNESDRSLLVDMRKFSERVENLRSRAEGTDLFRANRELEAYRKEYSERIDLTGDDSAEKEALNRLNWMMEDELEKPEISALETVKKYREKLLELQAGVEIKIPVETL